MTSHSLGEETRKRQKQHLEWGLEGALGETLKYSKGRETHNSQTEKEVLRVASELTSSPRLQLGCQGARCYHRCWSSVAVEREKGSGPSRKLRTRGRQEAQVPFRQHRRSPGGAGRGEGRLPATPLLPSLSPVPGAVTLLILLFWSTCLQLGRDLI